MDRIKIGIIGAGYIGGVHAHVLARDGRARISSVYDVVEERAHGLALSSGAAVSQSVEELIESCSLANANQSMAILCCL